MFKLIVFVAFLVEAGFLFFKIDKRDSELGIEFMLFLFLTALLFKVMD